jgi:hypothetical protein
VRQYGPVILAMVYFGVALGLLSRILLGWRFLRRLRRESEPVHESRALLWAEDLGAAHCLTWPLPRVRESRAVVVPLTAGWRDAVIVLPADWPRWDDWKLRAVLAHELTHIRRSDWCLSVLASLNKCVFWFHPLAWWLERRLAALAEEASDEATVRMIGDAPRYAGVVLDFASRLRHGSARVALHGAAMARPHVGRRIERILNLAPAGSGIVTGPIWVAILACAAPLVYGAATARLERPLAPLSGISSEVPAIMDSMADARRLTRADAAKLEQDLALDPENLQTRLTLVSHYFLSLMPQARVNHIFWFIEHHPELDLTSSLPTRILGPPTGRAYQRLHPFNSPADYEQAKALWLKQAAIHARDPRVLGNAAAFVQETDSAVAEGLLKRARGLEPSEKKWIFQLASLYVRAIRMSLSQHASNDPMELAFATRARTELQNSKDAVLVGTAGELMSERARSLSDSLSETDTAGNSRDMAGTLASFAEFLLQRAASLER